jgi:P-type Ca2+ transporter type 2C
MTQPYSTSVLVILKELQTNNKKGLSSKERSSRLRKYGPNSLPQTKKASLLSEIKEQLSNPIVMLLLGTTVIAGVTGEFFESILICSIVFSMTAIGIFLERQSQKSLDKLTSLQTPFTSILSEGKIIEVPSESLVPGDILILNEGDLISADARVIQTNEAKVDEAPLTGESLPVEKSSSPVKKTTSLGDQKSMVFSGTVLVEGSLQAVVIKTGKETEVGKIAEYLNETKQTLTPLQKELEKVGDFLLKATLVSVIGLFAIYILRGKGLVESLLATTSLAIAFIPEGLSAVLTITLALAVSEMVKKKVVVKRLVAAEGLGSITHIATDKTGTITEGQMHVVKVFLGKSLYFVGDKKLRKEPAYDRLIDVIRFCNNNKGPTEQALVSFLEAHGFSYELEGRKAEYRFNSAVKRMSVVREHKGSLHLFSKGAPDVLIPMSSFYFDQKINTFTEKEKIKALEMAEKLAGEGFRVLALADRIKFKVKNNKREDSESQLCFVGLVALMDPLRSTVKETVIGLRNAGVTPLMITGDHPAIAQYIALEAGILSKKRSGSVLIGQDLDMLLPSYVVAENRQKLLAAQVFARVRPEHKALLVEFYQQEGYRIAMAGDGVNDAAAIKKSNIGIAMSNGTGLTKDIADVVITGTYDALLRAVSIGRTVMLRTQLYLHYLLSGNACEVGVFFFAVIFNLPIPLTPVMLLLINLLTDALPAIAMAVEPEDPDLIKHKPDQESQKVLSSTILRGISIQGIISTLLLSGVFWWLLPAGEILAQTAVFSLYIFQKTLRGFTARSFTRSVLEYGFLSNWLMNIALGLVVITWMVVVLVIPEIFGMTKISSQLIAQLMGMALILPIVEEITKVLNRYVFGKPVRV